MPGKGRAVRARGTSGGKGERCSALHALASVVERALGQKLKLAVLCSARKSAGSGSVCRGAKHFASHLVLLEEVWKRKN